MPILRRRIPILIVAPFQSRLPRYIWMIEPEIAFADLSDNAAQSLLHAA